jgi:hypothetical protein
MFDELTRRGMGGYTGTMRERTVSAAKAAGIGNVESMSANELDKLRLNPDVAKQMETADFTRIADTLKKYSGAVAAMRDIFGDMGKPNAPMAELIAGLEAMTQGSLTQIDPGRLSSMVRMTHNLAKITGVSMDTAMMMQQHAAAVGQGMGLEPIFAVHATQGALAFGGAMRGSQLFSNPVWGLGDANQQKQLDVNLRMGAAASALVNRGAAASRMSNAIGGFAAGSGAANFVDAMRTGALEFINDQGKSQHIASMTDAQFTDMLTTGGAAAGVDGGLVRSFISQKFTNREESEKYGMQNVGRQAQSYDVEKYLKNRLRESFAARLVSQGVAPAEADKLAAEAAERASSALMNASREDQTDPAKRQKIISNALKGTVDNTDVGDQIKANLGAAGATAFYNSAAASGWGHFETELRRGDLKHFQSGTNALVQTNKETHAEARLTTLQAKAQTEMQAALDPLGRGGLLRSVVGAIQGLGHGAKEADIQELVGKTFGVKNAEVQAALVQPLQDLSTKMNELDDLQKQLQASTDPKEQVELSRKIEIKKAEVNAAASAAATVAGDKGILVSKEVSNTEAAAGVRQAHRVSRMADEAQASQAAQGDWGEYSKSKEGREYRKGVRSAMDANVSLIDKALSSDSIGMHLGPDGRKKLEAARASHARLKALADKYADGDVSRLLAGNLIGVTDEEKAEIMAEVGAARAIQTEAAEGINSALSGGTPKWQGTEEEKKKLQAEIEKDRAEIATGADKVVSELAQLHGFDDLSDKEKEQLAKTIDKQGLAYGQQLLSSRKNLAKHAEKGGYGKDPDAVRGLLKDLREAKTDEEKKAIYAKLGIEGDDAAIKELEASAALQDSSGFGNLGASTSLDPGVEGESSTFKERLRGVLGAKPRPGADPADTAADGSLVITGTLTINGEVGELEGAGSLPA